MEKELEYQALEELREDQRQIKPKTLIIFAVTLVVVSALMIVFPTVMPRPFYHFVMILSIVSIFGLIFNGRVALTITKRRFKTKRPHRRLSELSDPDDLNVSVEEALKRIAERQERELQKRGLR